MDVRCPSCGATFTISREYLAQAVAKADKKKHKYHAVDCIRCRKQVKLPLNDMRRYAAPPEDDVEAETAVKVEE
jgi:hypothetical protein